MGLKHQGPSRRVRKSNRWTAVRLDALRRDGWQCVKCGARGRLEVDHIQAVRDRPDLAYEVDGLQTLCRVCHSRKTHQEMGLPPPNPERQKWRAALAKMQSGKVE